MFLKCYNKIWNLDQFSAIEIQPAFDRICFFLPSGERLYQEFRDEDDFCMMSNLVYARYDMHHAKAMSGQ